MLRFDRDTCERDEDKRADTDGRDAVHEMSFYSKRSDSIGSSRAAFRAG